MIYCATSVYENTEVDHIFEAEDYESALEFADSQGWVLLDGTIDSEIIFEPWPEVFH